MISFDVCESGAPLKRMERPTPTPTGSEVLLKVLAAGVCHSDIHIWDGYYDMGGGRKIQLTDRGIKLPLTMGHENVGEVVALGPDARGAKLGERGLVFPWIGCGECKVCKANEEQLCTTHRSLGVYRNGGYADHLLVPHPRYLLDIGDMPPERAAPLACSGVTTYGALKKLGPMLNQEPVVIIGAGGLGLMALALLKAMVGVEIVISPPNRPTTISLPPLIRQSVPILTVAEAPTRSITDQAPPLVSLMISLCASGAAPSTVAIAPAALAASRFA